MVKAISLVEILIFNIEAFHVQITLKEKATIVKRGRKEEDYTTGRFFSMKICNSIGTLNHRTINVYRQSQ